MYKEKQKKYRNFLLLSESGLIQYIPFLVFKNCIEEVNSMKSSADE
jgi:hypothetical protein